MNNIQAVILAGGKGKRLGIDAPKCMLDLNGKKLIDICIDNLLLNNISEYVFLLGYKYEIVQEYLVKYNNIKKRYSIDRAKSEEWGKGKAFRYSLDNDAIDKNKPSLITFPDDIISDPFVYERFIESHMQAKKRYGVIASMMLVLGTRYPYGVAKLDENNLIYEFEEKPFLTIPTNIGIYIFEPAVYSLAMDVIKLEEPKPLELENTIIPILAREKKLNGFTIDADKWIPINTIKEYEEAQKRFTISHVTKTF
ncbi:MAG: sugar phosphate nucleotidyltransferase [Candidatus Nitrosocaldaceae archaeon]